MQCSSSVLDSLRFAAFCSTAAFLSVTALRALVLRTCLPQCSFIARSGEAGSVAKGISKIAWCAAPWPAQAAVCRDVTPGGAAGRSLSSTSPGLSTREGIRQFWARLTGNSSHPPLLSFHTCTHSSRASYSPGFFLDQAAMRLHCMDFATRMHPYLW